MMSHKTIQCPKCNNEIEIYENPIPTVDIIEIESKGIILINRKNYPYAGLSLRICRLRRITDEQPLEKQKKKQI
jgi:hypothetical protein